jgi:hypothetical protein
MKYIKSFLEINESVITPEEITNPNRRIVTTFEDLVEYGIENNFDVVEYDEFYNSLSDDDKKTAPPSNEIPFFALFNANRGKAMFVICDKNVVGMIPNFIYIINDIIGHENVHKEQNARRNGLKLNMPNPTDKKEYFSNKDEIMAFSWTIANGLFGINKDLKSAFRALKYYKGTREVNRLWEDITKNCDTNVINKYMKYIYMYLEEMYEKKNNTK